MAEMLSLEINIFCIWIQMMIMYKIYTGIDKRESQRLFMWIIVFATSCFTLDSIGILIESGYLETSVSISYLVKILYHLCCGIGTYIWFLYVEIELESKIIYNKKYRCLSRMPVIALIILAVGTYKNGWLFYIDENNMYQLGEWYILQIIIIYSYVVFTFIHALEKALRKENYINKSKYLNFVYSIMAPLVFVLIQFLFLEIPTFRVGMTITILQVYINNMSQMISVDPLTQLNNRNQFLKYLLHKMKSYDHSKALYLLIIDVDYFKKINDQYGHIEGDKALTQIAAVLKQVCKDEKHFACRYGGDEFIIVCEVKDENDIKSLCQQINHNLARVNEKPYKLSVTIGYKKYTEQIESIPEFIEQADQELYKLKQSRK
ncbi:MAG: diguanylate cyclase [Cellulosilyticum sp.]|nr:diguanylate cyclase [Cellulosilyticum sp.]